MKILADHRFHEAPASVPMRRSVGLILLSAVALVVCLLLTGVPSAGAATPAAGPLSYRDCGYGKRGLQITAVQARQVSCNKAWDIVAGGMRKVMAKWEPGWFQTLLASGGTRNFTYEGWRCKVRAEHREGYSLTCESGSAKIRSGTGA